MAPGSSAAPGSVSSSPVTRTATRGPLCAAELGSADRRRDAQLGGAELRARLQNDGIDGDVLAGAPDILAGPRFGHRNPIVFELCRLYRGQVRHASPDPPPFTAVVRSTGTTASAPSGTTAPVEIRTAEPAETASPTNGRPARASPITSSSAARPCHHRVAVHRRAVEGRHVDRARHVFGQHSTERGVQRNRLVPEPGDGVEHAPAGLVDRDQLAHGRNLLRKPGRPSAVCGDTMRRGWHPSGDRSRALSARGTSLRSSGSSV